MVPVIQPQTISDLFDELTNLSSDNCCRATDVIIELAIKTRERAREELESHQNAINEHAKRMEELTQTVNHLSKIINSNS